MYISPAPIPILQPAPLPANAYDIGIHPPHYANAENDSLRDDAPQPKPPGFFLSLSLLFAGIYYILPPWGERVSFQSYSEVTAI